MEPGDGARTEHVGMKAGWYSKHRRILQRWPGIHAIIEALETTNTQENNSSIQTTEVATNVQMYVYSHSLPCGFYIQKDGFLIVYPFPLKISSSAY